MISGMVTAYQHVYIMWAWALSTLIYKKIQIISDMCQLFISPGRHTIVFVYGLYTFEIYIHYTY